MLKIKPPTEKISRLRKISNNLFIKPGYLGRRDVEKHHSFDFPIVLTFVPMFQSHFECF